MSTAARIPVDVALRSVVLLAVSEGIGELVAATSPDDDGLGTGLTVMLALVYAAAGWGVWDGFHRTPVQLGVTWLLTGLVVSIGSTLYSHLRYGEWAWSELADDLDSGLIFWAALIFAPAFVCGIVQSVLRDAAAHRPRG